jgi:histone deacetylase 1/2
VNFVFNRTTALEQLQELNFAPSVQMQDVPRESLSHHLGFRKEDHDERDELDKKLARTLSTHFRWLLH